MQTRIVVASRERVEISDNVVAFNNWIQQLYQVQQCLKQKRIISR